MNKHSISKRVFVQLIILVAFLLPGIPSYAEELSDIPYERFLNIRSAVSTDISPDSSDVIFRTNITGVNQIWRVPIEGGWPHQITFYENSIWYAYYVPNSKKVVFGMDTEGNERTQLFMMNDDGSDIVSLSNDPEHVYRLGAISRDGSQIVYSSNKREKQFFDIYVMDLETLDEKLVYQFDGYNYASGFSETGKYIFASRYETNKDNDLYMIEIESGEVTHLTPHEESANFFFQKTTRDDSGVYIISDHKTEFQNLRYLDLATKEWKTVVDAGWDIVQTAFDHNGSKLAFTINEAGYTRLRIKDLETGIEVPSPSQPETQIFNIRFSEDDRYLLYTRNDSTHPSDVWILDFKKPEVRQLTHSATAGIAIDKFVKPKLVEYESYDGMKIPGFLYLPENAKKDGSLPAIISAHGGPEGQHKPYFHRTNNYFISRGFVIFAPNIRGSDGYGKTYTHLDDRTKRESANEDIRMAAEWLKSSGYADPDKIGIMGTSYGGYVSLMALTMYPDIFAAGVSNCGIASFESFLNNTASWRRHLREAEYGFLSEDLEFMRKISPLNHIDQIKAPLMLIQGANDPRVPQSEADQMADAIRAKGGIVEYLLFEDEGHGLARLENKLEAYPAIAEFFMKYLIGE